MKKRKQHSAEQIAETAALLYDPVYQSVGHSWFFDPNDPPPLELSFGASWDNDAVYARWGMVNNATSPEADSLHVQHLANMYAARGIMIVPGYQHQEYFDKAYSTGLGRASAGAFNPARTVK